MAAKKSPKPAAALVCPVTGKKLTYKGVGRPPLFHDSATAKQRREYRASK